MVGRLIPGRRRISHGTRLSAGRSRASLTVRGVADADWEEDDGASESPFRAALAAGRIDEAGALPDERVADPATPRWLVTSMLEDVGLWLAHARPHDEAIASFELALGLGWNVVPDGRCEIARALLPAGRHG